jgi:hypothetical protein
MENSAISLPEKNPEARISTASKIRVAVMDAPGSPVEANQAIR